MKAKSMSHEAGVRRHYDELDAFYRDLWGEHLHHGLWHTGRETPAQAARQLVARVARLVRLRRGARLCDVGSGYGATARFVAGEYEARVTAFTLSPAQHTYAQAQRFEGANPPTYRLHDWLKNELPAASFEAVVAIESASHMADRARFFAEAFRVLRPGGRLVACIWLSAARPARWQQRLLLDPIVRAGRLAGLDSAAAYLRWAADAGFTVETFQDLSRQVRRTWDVCLRRLGTKLLADRRYRRFLLDPAHANRDFALALPCLWLAYRTGAMRYGVFVARKPERATGAA